MITLETDRLILRMSREDDLEPYAKICAPRRGASRRAAPPENTLYVIYPLGYLAARHAAGAARPVHA